MINSMAKLLDPRRLVAGAVAAAASLLLLFMPPIPNAQARFFESYIAKGCAALAVFLVTVALGEPGRTVGRVFLISLAVVVFLLALTSGGYFLWSIRDAKSVQSGLGGWDRVLDNEFVARQEFSTARVDVNGSGNAATGNGILTLRLRSTHVANQPFFITDIAPAGQEYYVETSVRRQYGPIGSGCFLAFGVINSDRYYLFEVTYDQRPNRPLHSAQIFQEVQAAPAIEKPVDQSPSLPYVQYWSLLWPPGEDSQWTRLAIHRAGGDYDFFVDDRLVDHVTNLPVPNARVTVGAFDPGTPNGSYVGCQFRYLRAWRK
jgi:hypothetical protein